MREIWIEVKESIPGEVKGELFKAAAGKCDVAFVGEQDIKRVRERGVKVASTSGECDIYVLEELDEEKLLELKRSGKTVAVRVVVRGRKDEEKALKAVELSSDYIILSCPDWKVIPLENIIAKAHGKTKLLAEVSSPNEAKLALETLELGADGVILKTRSPDEIAETVSLVKGKEAKIEIKPVKIVSLKQIGMGARVCVDTCDIMKPGEGMLVGCQSSGLFLIQAEVEESPYVEPRPFRVNAGPVSLYILSSPDKTKYLSELKAGDEVLIVDRNGRTRMTNVGRVKIEWRPMMLIEAESQGKILKTIVQNAETIRLVTAEGSKSVAELKPGDEVLAYVTEGGRHFGTLVKEEKVIER